MSVRPADRCDRDLINAKYRQKIDAYADRQADVSRSEAEQQFLLCCRHAAEWSDATPPAPVLRQIAWRWLTVGPEVAKQYAKQ